MSTFINNDITNGGRLLLAKGHLGQKIEFTKIVMGDGYLPPGTAIRDMTAVVNPVVNVPVSKMKMNADGTVIIGGRFSNSDIMTEFFYRELALFAKGGDGAEILYCYGDAGDFAERIMPAGGSSVIEKVIDIVTAIGTTTNVTATIVRTTTADEIGYNDNVTKLGAENLQEAIEILAKNPRGGSMAELPDTGFTNTPLFFKLIGTGRKWRTDWYGEPDENPANSAVQGFLLTGDGEKISGKIQLDDGTVVDLSIL